MHCSECLVTITMMLLSAFALSRCSDRLITGRLSEADAREVKLPDPGLTQLLAFMGKAPVELRSCSDRLITGRLLW
jgi:hypothetical protein